MIKININDTDIVKKTIDVLAKGGLVIFPSDTVYGLLVDATNEQAVRKLITFKERPAGKAISIFVADLNMASQYVKFDKKQEAILNEIFPGPFTAVLPSRHKISRLLESEKGTLGIRIPKSQSINRLNTGLKRPITATSANLFSKNPHYNLKTLFRELSKSKKGLIDLVVDGGELPHNKPSTVIDLTENKLKILREGDMNFKHKQIIKTESPEETERLGRTLIKNEINKSKKLTVFIIKGELGVGKTVLVKGMGKELGLDNIISPSYVISYEYKTNNKIYPTFVHFDLYHIQDKDEFLHLGIENYLKPGNILVFEWGEKAGEIINLLKNKAIIVYVKMEYLNQKKRQITLI